MGVGSREISVQTKLSGHPGKCKMFSWTLSLIGRCGGEVMDEIV